MVERLQALKERSSMDFYESDDPRCPHCANCVNVEDHELFELYSEGSHLVGCPYCEMDFTVRTTVSKFTFSTEDQDED